MVYSLFKQTYIHFMFNILWLTFFVPLLIFFIQINCANQVNWNRILSWGGCYNYLILIACKLKKICSHAQVFYTDLGNYSSTVLGNSHRHLNLAINGGGSNNHPQKTAKHVFPGFKLEFVIFQRILNSQCPHLHSWVNTLKLLWLKM